MGKEKGNGKGNTLIDFLYKDLDLINSLYSQIFQGALNTITKTEISADSSSREAKLSAGLFGGKIVSNEALNESITSSINPLDNTILELIEALDINSTATSLDDICPRSIQAVKGTLSFRDYKVVNDLFPLITESNMIPEFTQPVNPNAKGKDKNFTFGKLVQKLISIMPFGLEFEIKTTANEKISAIIKDDYLTIKSNDLLRFYGLNLPGEWTVIGITDIVSQPLQSSQNQFKGAVDEITKLYSSIINENSTNYVIRPIVIYRKI